MRKIMLVLLLVLNSWSINVAYSASLTFKLASQDSIITEKSFPKKYLLIAVGYMGCPDICPTTLIDIAEAMKQLDKLGEADEIQPLFITIDPTNDNIKNLEMFTSYFNKKIIGLRGEFPELNAVVKQLNATYGYKYNGKEVFPPNLPKGYSVYHSTYIYLYDLNRNLVDIYSYNMHGDAMAAAINKAINKGD